MISPQIKDIIDLVASVGTVLGFFSIGFGWFITRREGKQKAERAINQLDLLATNHFPHMTATLEKLADEGGKQTDILTELRLGQVETNTLLRAKVL